MTNVDKTNNNKFVPLEKINIRDIYKQDPSKALSENVFDIVNSNDDVDSDITIDSNTFSNFYELKKFIFKSGTITKHTDDPAFNNIPILQLVKKFLHYPIAGELLELSMLTDEERQKTIEKQDGKILSAEEARVFMSENGLEEDSDGHTRSEQMKLEAVLFSKDSKISKTLEKNKGIKQEIRNWLNEGAIENKKVEYKTSYSGSTDLRLAFGAINIIGLHKTDDGYVEGYVEDVYDFDPSYSKDEKNEVGLKDKTIKKLVDAAVELQDENFIKNYRVLVPVRFKIDDLQ